MDPQTSLLRPPFQVMVSEHEIQRLVQGADDEVIVVQRQVPRAEDQVDISVAGLEARAVDQRVHVVGYAEESHCVHTNIVKRAPWCNASRSL